MAEQEALLTETPELDPLSDEALDALEQPQPPVEEPAVEVAPAPEVVVPQAEAVVETQPDAEAQAAAEEAKKWAGKYTSPEDLEKAYQASNAEATRMSMELAERQRQIAELQAFRQQAEPLLTQMQQAQVAQQAQITLPPPPENFDPMDEGQVRAYYASLTEAQQQHLQTALQAQRAEMEQRFAAQSQQQQAAQQQQAFANEVQQFRTKYPDAGNYALELKAYFEENAEFVTPNAQTLETAYQVVTNPPLKSLLDRLNVVPSAENIARGQEALADPTLLNYIIANPSSLTDTADDGWAAAKDIALRLAALQVQPSQTVDDKAQARVVSGGTSGPAAQGPSGAPAGIDPKDWEFFGGETEADPLAKLFQR